MTDSNQPDQDENTDNLQILDALIPLSPLVFEARDNEDGRLVSRATQSASSLGKEYTLIVVASEPEENSRSAHEETLKNLLAGFFIIQPKQDADADRSDPFGFLRIDKETEGMTYEIDVDCDTAVLPDLVFALDPTVRQGRVDRWRSRNGLLQRGQIKVTSGRATLRAGNQSSSRSATGYSAAIRASDLTVRGDAASSNYTFYGSYKRA